MELGDYTKEGRLALGRAIQAGLEEKGWEQKDLVEELVRWGRKKTNRDEISRFLRADGTKLDASLVYSIARINARERFAINPATNEPFTAEEMIEIACELRNAHTGIRQSESCQCEDSPDRA